MPPLRSSPCAPTSTSVSPAPRSSPLLRSKNQPASPIWQEQCCPVDSHCAAPVGDRGLTTEWAPFWFGSLFAVRGSGDPRLQPVARRLGDLLVAEGLITKDQLAKAIAEQKHPEELGST